MRYNGSQRSQERSEGGRQPEGLGAPFGGAGVDKRCLKGDKQAALLGPLPPYMCRQFWAAKIANLINSFRFYDLPSLRQKSDK